MLVPVFGQQNLFNVPNGEITQPGRIFFQEQVNVSGSTTQFNTTLDYGLGHELEVGLNLFFLNFAENIPIRTQVNSTNPTFPLSPVLLANLQKGFHLTDWFRLSAGTQGGCNLGDANNLSFAYFAYGTATITWQRPGINFHFGLYHGNAAYNGVGDGSFMGGIEFSIIRRHLSFVGDFIQGTHANAVFVSGLLWMISDQVHLSVGWQKPYPDSATEQAAVFELTFI